jgi:hypothetical protein
LESGKGIIEINCDNLIVDCDFTYKYVNLKIVTKNIDVLSECVIDIGGKEIEDKK